MSKLDELIAKFCPNGVDFFRIKDVCDITRGRVMSKGYIREHAGDYPVYSSQTENDGEFGRINTYDFDGEYLTWTTDGANAGAVFYRNGKFSVTNVCGLLKTRSDDLITKFLFYTLSIEAPKYVNAGMGNPKLMSNVMARVKVPVPPKEVQREIVHVLDEFTLLTSELSAELSARRKQYEYYRDTLLDFSVEIPKVTLKEIATDMYRGAGIKRDQVTEEGIPCVRYGEIYTTYNTWIKDCVSHTRLEYVASPKYFGHGDILFAITGEGVEDIVKSVVYLGDDECLAGGDIVVMKHNQNPRYIAHVLSTTYARERKSRGKVKSKVVHSNVSSIENIVIPLPSLDVQERYADVLDNFEKMCNDLNIGLPAEIEARQKQYEYYRALLLTFAETGNGTLTDRQAEIRLIQYVFGYVNIQLRDIATVTRGGYFQKKDFVELGYPCIHYGQIYTHFGVTATKVIKYLNEDVYNKSKHAVPNDIVMAVTSENVEDVCSCTAWMGEAEIAVSGHTAIIHHNQNAKYLSYYFHTEHFFRQKKKLAHGTKVIEVTPNKLLDIIIPLPTPEEQERIVSILDRFDSLSTSIEKGIPAEIDARQKQYEYYRNILLTFKEKK